MVPLARQVMELREDLYEFTGGLVSQATQAEKGAHMPLEIFPAYDQLDNIRMLFTEYVQMLGVDLSFQKYDEEFARLPGKYSTPDGMLLIAHYNEKPAGCMAYRRFDSTACEMKRLYVRPEFRGKKIGVSLVEQCLAAAKAVGYKRMLLDTLETLDKSVAIYRRQGFRETLPYYPNPYPGVLYFELNLAEYA